MTFPELILLMSVQARPAWVGFMSRLALSLAVLALILRFAR